MNLNKSYYFFIMLIVLILTISAVSAKEDINKTLIDDSSDISQGIVETNLENNVLSMNDSQESIQSNHDNEITSISDESIEVNDWNELQYYCSQTDKDYTLKLKANTNYYPDNPSDSNYQIKIKNNVKIIGGNGSYIGDASPNARGVDYSLIVVESNVKCAMHLENITFKFIEPMMNYHSLKIIQISGRNKYTSILKNCLFDHIGTTSNMYDYLVTMGSGNAILDNCSFINCWSTYGLIRVTDSKMNKTTHMVLNNCYFKGNHAAIAPGCVYNSGKLDVINSSFIGNGAGYWAGAVHTAGYGNTSIYDSYFKDNVAGWNGGALYTYAYLQLYNTTFINNHCTTNNGGGAIGACKYISTPHIYVEGCLFEKNENNCWSLDGLSTTGTGRGGAISFMDEGSIEVRDTIFIANVASICSAICAWAAEGYGSPNVIIVNNYFINQTRAYDPLNVQVSGTPAIVSDNYYYGNSIVFSNLTLTKLDEGNEQATFKITNTLAHPSYYDSDILDKTLYDVYINNKYVKTVNSTVFTIDFGDLDICSVYVIPTISNQKSNEVTAVSTREYIFVSKTYGNDINSGISRDAPVNTIERALELANIQKNIILLDGDYSENLEIDYDVTIKGEGNATLTNHTSFTINADNFTLKNLNVNNLVSDTFIKANTNLFISNCIFKDNDAILIDNDGFSNVTNSILLNNSNVIQGSNYDLDYNWWGNTLENLNKPNDLVNIWLVLNATSNVDALENNQLAIVQFGFYLNNGVKYNNLRELNLNITAVNGTVDNNVSSSISNVKYTLTAFGDGILYASYEDVITQVSFRFLKSNPVISVETEDIMFGDDLNVKVNVPKDAGGNITVCVHNQTQTLDISSQNTVFTFKGLKANNYNIQIIYSGDKKYLSKNSTANVNVDKYNSTTSILFDSIEVGEDLIITVKANDDATGNITLYINNQHVSLNLTDASANYTISKIPRGDYVIQAFYNGDDKYLTSSASTKIEVDNIESSMTIKADDITYGQTAVIEVKLNDDATGNVSVTVDGVTNTSKINNGMAIININALNAGTNKNITVFYTGDDNYYNKTSTVFFTIRKADLVFDISSQDIKIGQDAVVKITVPKRITGTFTIGDVVLNIPMTGEVEYVISDLSIGNYTITAIYNGNNYNTVTNSTSFKVNEYAQPQWPNNGVDTENTGKTKYIADNNSGILYNLTINEAINGITIDSDGNIYITTDNGIYSYDCEGNYRWNFSSQDVHGNFSSSVIGRDIIITPKSGDTLYFVNQTSGERYGMSNIYQASSLFTPLIDSNANVYVLSEYQRDLNIYYIVIVPYNIWENDGNPILVNLDSAAPLVPLTLNDDIIVVLSEGRLRLIDANTLEHKFIKSGNYQAVRPVIGDGNVIYAVLDDSIVAYDMAGLRLFKTKISGGIGSQLLFDSDKGVYVTNANGNLYRYDALTGKGVLVSDLIITSGILIDANHNLYFGCDNLFYAIDSEGNVLWKTDLESKITGNPVMNKDGFIYVVTEGSKLFALGNSVESSEDINSTPIGNGTNVSGDTNSTPIGNGTNVSGDNNSTQDNANNESGTNASTNPSSGGSDTNAKAIKNASKITAKKKTFKRKAKVKKYTITLKSGKNPIKKVKVTIKVGKKTYSAKTNAKGKATFKIKKLTKKGKYTAIIKFKGNKSFKPTTKKVKIVIK